MSALHASRRLCALLAFVVGTSASLDAAPAEMKLKWADLSGQIMGHKIALTTAAGHSIEGVVLSVTPDALNLKVTKTSDRNAIAKGPQSFPREPIKHIGLKTKGVKGRIIGVSIGIGILAGSVAGGYQSHSFEGLGIVFIGGIIGLGVMIGGYFLGNAADQHMTTITVLPD